MKTIIIIILLFVLTFFTFSQRTYIWSGSVNSNFSTAGNWNPVRQIGYADDKLVFNSGSTLNITNVYQVTVGQISVMNNTHVQISPSSGNPRVLFIQGNGVLQGMGNNNEHNEVSHVKYDEYMNPDNTDLASSKYEEYRKSDSNYLATIKYNEYKTPPSNGMGDIKEEPIYDSNTGDDLLVEQGSSLTIQASDPKLSIYLKQNATAAIYGSLVFSGEGQNELNSFDSYAIAFKDGSTLVQSCPGFIFSNSGINNSVLFETGSNFEVRHEAAGDPFGMAPPSSKVIFDENSNFIINMNNPNVLRLNGRSFPNIIIGNNCNINVHEIFTNDFSINKLTINTGGKLHVRNLIKTASPNFNIKGDLTVNGELHFMPDETNKLNLYFDKGSNQIISGTGALEFGTGISSLFICNSLTLQRDIETHCKVIHQNGTINTAGHTFKIFNQYISAQMLFAGIIILPESAPELNKGNENSNNYKITGQNNSIPASYSVSQNYPNPFNPKTKIDYAIPRTSIVSISVYDITGENVATLVSGNKGAQNYTVEFDGSNLASGIYIYRIIAEAGGDKFSKTQKMCLVK